MSYVTLLTFCLMSLLKKLLSWIALPLPFVSLCKSMSASRSLYEPNPNSWRAPKIYFLIMLLQHQCDYIPLRFSKLLLISSSVCIHHCNNGELASFYIDWGDDVVLGYCADCLKYICAYITFIFSNETLMVPCHVLTGGECQVQSEADWPRKDAAGCSSDRPQWGSGYNLGGRLCCHGLWEIPFSHI